MLLPIYVLQGCSCYLVAVIVFLRLVSIKTQLPTTSAHNRLSNIISVAITIVLLLISLIGFILSFNPFYNKTPHTIYKIIAFHIFFTFPILSTLIMYAVLLHMLRQKRDTDSTKFRKTKKSLAKLTKRIVICMVVCNMPFIIWVQYLGVKFPSGGFAENVFDTNFGV